MARSKGVTAMRLARAAAQQQQPPVVPATEGEAIPASHGRTPRGERAPHHKLTVENVIEILRGEIRPSVLAEKFGVARSTISCVRKGRSWGWLVEDGAGSYRDAIDEIKRRHLAGLPIPRTGYFKP